MMRSLRILGQTARGFRRREDGNATIEFVLALPLLMLIFTISYESGMLSTRHVMLERGLDQTVRLVRIGAIPNPSHELLVENMCKYAKIIPNCGTNMRLEMVKRDPYDWETVSSEVACVDRREEDPKPLLGVNSAGGNELLILRACALFDPMMPSIGLGAKLPQQAGGGYALVSTSSFVVEPN